MATSLCTHMTYSITLNWLMGRMFLSKNTLHISETESVNPVNQIAYLRSICNTPCKQSSHESSLYFFYYYYFSFPIHLWECSLVHFLSVQLP